MKIKQVMLDNRCPHIFSKIVGIDSRYRFDACLCIAVLAMLAIHQNIECIVDTLDASMHPYKKCHLANTQFSRSL